MVGGLPVSGVVLVGGTLTGCGCWFVLVPSTASSLWWRGEGNGSGPVVVGTLLGPEGAGLVGNGCSGSGSLLRCQGR